MLDLCLTLDTTGSLAAMVPQIKAHIRETAAALLRDVPGTRIALIAHGDYCDSRSSYVLRALDFTDDAGELEAFLAQRATPTFGGDAPEALELVLRHCARALSWRGDAPGKAVVLTSDSYPHPASFTDQAISWREEAGALAARGVRVYGVQAGWGSVDRFYAEVARLTGGAHIKLKSWDRMLPLLTACAYREAGVDASPIEGECDGALVAGAGAAPCREAWWAPELDQGAPQYAMTSADPYTFVAVRGAAGGGGAAVAGRRRVEARAAATPAAAAPAAAIAAIKAHKAERRRQRPTLARMSTVQKLRVRRERGAPVTRGTTKMLAARAARRAATSVLKRAASVRTLIREDAVVANTRLGLVRQRAQRAAMVLRDGRTVGDALRFY